MSSQTTANPSPHKRKLNPNTYSFPQYWMISVILNVISDFHCFGLRLGPCFSFQHVEQTILFRIRMDDKSSPVDALMGIRKRALQMVATHFSHGQASIPQFLLLHFIGLLCVRYLGLWLIMPWMFR